MDIKKIALGSQGLIVPKIVLGCMDMTDFEEGNEPTSYRFGFQHFVIINF